MRTKRLLFLCITLLVGACTYQFPDEEQYSASDMGTIDPSRMVAVGDDFLAGVMDGALFHSGQLNSVPYVIADRIGVISPISFIQPEIESETGFNFFKSSAEAIYGKWIYRFEDVTAAFPDRVLTQGQEPGNFSGDKSALGNFALPGLITGRIDSLILNENPYYTRIASSPGSSTLLSDIKNSKPTFIILWLGMNDFLGYATRGANIKSNTRDISWYPDVKMTSAEEFQQQIEEIIEQLMEDSDCKMVIGNLPDIGSFPFFNARPYNKLFLEGEKLGAARSRYAKFNEAVAVFNRTVSEENQRPFIDFFDNSWNLHPQPLVIIDSTLSDASYPNGVPLEKYRQLSGNEMVLLELTDKMVEDGYGSVIPLPENLYLSGTEIEEIETHISSFNSAIMQIVSKYPGRLLLADIASEVNEIARVSKTDAWGEFIEKTVYYADGVPVDGTLGTTSIFSIDGLHFNKRGNAFLANIFIGSINAGYDAKIPEADVNRYAGNTYSASF